METTGGFYFNVYYATWRREGVLINEWCQQIVNISLTVKNFDPAWSTVSARDAVKRLTQFFSRSERQVIEHDLISNHELVWNQNEQSLRLYFRNTDLSAIIKVVTSIDISKFPQNFDPFKHTPDALYDTLFQYQELVAKQERCDAAITAAEARAAAAEDRVERAEAELRSARCRANDRKPRDDKSRAKRAPDLSKESDEVKYLMRLSRKGDYPCLKCARLGMREFHVCSPAVQAAALDRNGLSKPNRDGKQPANPKRTNVPFPPVKDSDRLHPKSSYPEGACPQCILEDVPPGYARHKKEDCFRLPGGPCDKEGAKSREARLAVVRREVKKLMEEKFGKGNKGKRPKKRTTQSAVKGKGKQVKFTGMAVRTPVATAATPAVPDTEPVGDDLPGAAVSVVAPSDNDKPQPTIPVVPRTESTREDALPPSDGSNVPAAEVTPESTPADKPNYAKKKRSRKYAKSAFAIKHPLTMQELEFAAASCPSFVSKGHLVHQLTAEGKEHHLMDLRVRHRVHLSAKKGLSNPVPAPEGTGDGHEGTSQRPNEGDSSPERSRKRKRRGKKHKRKRKRGRRHSRSRSPRQPRREYPPSPPDSPPPTPIRAGTPPSPDAPPPSPPPARKGGPRSPPYLPPNDITVDEVPSPPFSPNGSLDNEETRELDSQLAAVNSALRKLDDADKANARPLKRSAPDGSASSAPAKKTKSGQYVPKKKKNWGLGLRNRLPAPPKSLSKGTAQSSQPKPPPPNKGVNEGTVPQADSEVEPGLRSQDDSNPGTTDLVAPAPGLKPVLIESRLNGPESPVRVVDSEPALCYEDHDDDDEYDPTLEAFFECDPNADLSELVPDDDDTQTTPVKKPVSPSPCSQSLPNPCVLRTTVGAWWSESAQKAQKEQRNEEEEREEEGETLDSIPSEKWLPARSNLLPRISMPAIRVSPIDKHVNSEQLPSETKGTRLLQGYLRYRDANGVVKRGRVALDTQSNGCYSLKSESLPRGWRPWEPRTVQGIGDLHPLGDPRSFTIMKDGEPVRLDTNLPNPGALTDGCVALLGLDAIYNLGINLAHAVRHTRHVDIKFLSNQDHLLEHRARDAFAQYSKQGKLGAVLHRTCHLSERVVKQYLEVHPNDYEKKPINIDGVDISRDLPRETRDLLLALCKRYDDVFASHTNTLPPCLEGVEPHMFKMKEGYKHKMASRPSFSPARAEAINQWLEWALDVGLVEPATNTSYASRLILAAKRKGSTPKSQPPDGLRVAWAGVDINEGITKTVPTYPDAWEQLYKVAGMKYKFSADGLKQYWSIPLCAEAREITAFWTPRGLYQFTRMVMGTKNAATVAQNAYTKAMHTMLPNRSFPHLANFADDFLGGAESPQDLVRVFEDFLIMCRKAKITLNPLKVRIGYEKEQFFGMTVNNGKIEPAMRNIDPVVNMTYPKNRSELRSVMGVFNQFSGFIKDYARGEHASILNQLVSPKAEWLFTDRHRKAIDVLKERVQAGLHLYAPDNSLPLVLETDGSDDGWGAVLYQVVDGEKRIIRMWSKQWKTEAWHKKPPYHREAKAWMNGMTLAMPFAACNPYPLQCWTDHSPLTWVKHTSGKGPVSQFIIDTLSNVDYEMHYLKGKDNVIADGLSRFPLLGPQTLRRSGLTNALDVLLATLLTTKVDTTKVWFDARKDTKFLLPNFYDWCDARKKSCPELHQPLKTCYQDALSESKLGKLHYTFGIWAPPADKICRQLRCAFKQDKPFACLVPSDLINRICVAPDGTVDEKIQTSVLKARKITFLSAGLTWIIHGVTITGHYEQVFMAQRVTPEIELNRLTRHLRNKDIAPPIPPCRTRADWIRAQHRARVPDLWKPHPKAFSVQDGLWVYQHREDEPPCTIVPEALQRPLIEWEHHQMCHMSAGKLYNVLKKKFFFHNMYSLYNKVVNDCALCNLLKARMRHAHQHFRAKLYCQPRTSYGADYYSVKQNKHGYNNILGIIDLSTGNLVLKAVKGRNAHNTAHTLFYEIIVRKGVPLRFHSDAAKEFLSTAMGSLQTMLGIQKSDTLAHNPRSNAKIERVWEFVGRCLRSMPPDQYAQFHLYMAIIAHVWNCTPDADTKITPFEAEHGMRCRSITESIMQDPPAEGLPANAEDLRTIAVAAAAFNEHIANIKAVERVNNANKLNSYGQPITEFQIGDKVTFYLPPNDKEAARMGKKPKHMLQYQGPAVITESLSPNNTAFKIKMGGRTYRRNIMHLSHYKSDNVVPAQLQLHIDNTIAVGSFVAVLDNTGDTRYHIAKVIDIGEQTTRLHYYATKAPRLYNAIWRPLYVQPHTNLVVMETPDTITRNHTLFIGDIDTMPLEDSLILLPNLGMTDRKRVNSRTRRILQSKTRYKHHRIGHTWTP